VPIDAVELQLLTNTNVLPGVFMGFLKMKFGASFCPILAFCISRLLEIRKTGVVKLSGYWLELNIGWNQGFVYRSDTFYLSEPHYKTRSKLQGDILKRG